MSPFMTLPLTQALARMSRIVYLQVEMFVFWSISKTTTIPWADNRNQAQLHGHGFKTSQKHPKIRHVSPRALYDAERAIRFHSDAAFPVLLHVCRESRQEAVRSGYVLASWTRWAPAQTWFNFDTDFLHTSGPEGMDYAAEFDARDRQRVKRLATSPYHSLSPVDMFQLV